MAAGGVHRINEVALCTGRSTLLTFDLQAKKFSVVE
jgi:hypothetical protein